MLKKKKQKKKNKTLKNTKNQMDHTQTIALTFRVTKIKEILKQSEINHKKRLQIRCN